MPQGQSWTLAGACAGPRAESSLSLGDSGDTPASLSQWRPGSLGGEAPGPVPGMEMENPKPGPPSSRPEEKYLQITCLIGG